MKYLKKNNGLGLNDSIAEEAFLFTFTTLSSQVFLEDRYLMPLKSCCAWFLCDYHGRFTLQRLPPFGECDLDPDSENRYSCYFLFETLLLKKKKMCRLETQSRRAVGRFSFD